VFVNDKTTESSQVGVERRAESFARHFLVPSRQAKRVWRSFATQGSPKALCEFMLEFGISRLAAVNIIRNLDLITDADASQLRSANVAYMMADSGLESKWNELVSGQSDPSASVWLVEASLNLYQQGLVPAKTVASVLDQPEEQVRNDLASQGWGAEASVERS